MDPGESALAVTVDVAVSVTVAVAVLVSVLVSVRVSVAVWVSVAVSVCVVGTVTVTVGCSDGSVVGVSVVGVSDVGVSEVDVGVLGATVAELIGAQAATCASIDAAAARGRPIGGPLCGDHGLLVRGQCSAGSSRARW